MMDKKHPKSRSVDTELRTQGWIRRFAADEPRLSEAVELYKSLGYEVRLEPATIDNVGEECKKCLLHKDCREYKTIYVRLKEKKAERKVRNYSPLSLKNR